MKKIFIDKLTKETVSLDELPVGLVMSDGSKIFIEKMSLWRVRRQAKGAHSAQVYLIDESSFNKVDPKTIGRKLLLEEEELVLGRARNPIYFGHHNWGGKLKPEEVKVWLKQDNIYFQKVKMD